MGGGQSVLRLSFTFISQETSRAVDSKYQTFKAPKPEVSEHPTLSTDEGSWFPDDDDESWFPDVSQLSGDVRPAEVDSGNSVMVNAEPKDNSRELYKSSNRKNTKPKTIKLDNKWAKALRKNTRNHR